MSTMKLDIKKFNRNTNFSLWKVKIKTTLIKHGVHKTFEGDAKKHLRMSEAKWKEIDSTSYNFAFQMKFWRKM